MKIHCLILESNPPQLLIEKILLHYNSTFAGDRLARRGDGGGQLVRAQQEGPHLRHLGCNSIDIWDLGQGFRGNFSTE